MISNVRMLLGGGFIPKGSGLAGGAWALCTEYAHIRSSTTFNSLSVCLFLHSNSQSRTGFSYLVSCLCSLVDGEVGMELEPHVFPLSILPILDPSSSRLPMRWTPLLSSCRFRCRSHRRPRDRTRHNPHRHRRRRRRRPRLPRPHHHPATTATM